MLRYQFELKQVRSTLIQVYGRVQGVGFRPFVYRLATSLNLKGYVFNSSKNVRILLQGDDKKIEIFKRRLREDAPPLSLIDRVSETEVHREAYREFAIKESQKEEGFVFISADIAVCEECLQEMRSPKDRRYRYPFINCTNCGPRYSIIEDIPYDRAQTTMKTFKMCKLCEEEYRNPLSRRFHAQPNSCFDCGPSLWLEDIEYNDIFKKIAELLKDGKILAVKGLGGFHIACDATNDDAVKLLRQRKNRPHKPFALMMKDIAMVEKYCFVSKEEKVILLSKERPIVLLEVKNLHNISEMAAPFQRNLGVMLPYTPYHYLIFDLIDFPLIMTSANITGEPIIKDNNKIKEDLRTIVDFYVLHNRDITHRTDDSVVFSVKGRGMQILRRSRGYVPDPVKLPIKVYPCLAMGAELKNTFTLAKDDVAIPSPHIGDLKNLETLEVYKDTIREYIHLFKIEPMKLITDLHPNYISTNIGLKLKEYMEVVQVQHHKAHIYSLLLDNQYHKDIVGFSFDGTGYGEDGQIWGGEIFTGNLNGLQRKYHFAYFPLTGGDKAIENPKRILLSYLLFNFPEYVKQIAYKYTENEIDITERLIKYNMTVQTSSAGRIFDLVSSLLDIRDTISYEAQAAIELEMAARESDNNDIYDYNIGNGIIDLNPMIINILKEKKKKTKSHIARAFHNTIVKIMVDIAEDLRRKTDINTVGFSGGVFQNKLLLSLAVKALTMKNFRVLLHRQVPANDGGISLGQIIMARKGAP